MPAKTGLQRKMTVPNVTIVVVPREQFSKARQGLESIFAHTTPAYKLIYIDGKSPSRLRRYLEDEAAEKGFRLIREERYLTGNQARNLAVPHIQTKYTVFIDNDVVPSPGWLEPLIECAEETGAWVVGPVYCTGDLNNPVIHTLGGEQSIDGGNGTRRWRERHFYCGRLLSDVASELHRRPLDLVEFHCLLMRTEVFDRLGPFDPALLSYFDHSDFCLMVRNAGGPIYVEPRSVVTYLPPPPLALSDVPYFMLRWSNRWINASAIHFAHKNGIEVNDPVFEDHFEYQQAQRARVLRHPRHVVRRILGYRALTLLEKTIDRVLDWTVTAHLD
jgi:GT2 family glycosyltransferase